MISRRALFHRAIPPTSAGTPLVGPLSRVFLLVRPDRAPEAAPDRLPLSGGAVLAASASRADGGTPAPAGTCEK
ncbi:hypothetical protein [Streptomyces sp. NPDC057695]|uniref:hypothetical protein n=1 Tax=Streptomyces sp. NPDC057695 TaxID=3346217 RepID=UPI0036C95010